DDVKIDDHQAVVRVTIPGKRPKQQVIKVPVGAPQTPSPTGQGNIHVVTLSGFRKQFPSEDPNTPVEEYYLEAYLDAELGGDLWQGHLRSMYRLARFSTLQYESKCVGNSSRVADIRRGHPLECS